MKESNLVSIKLPAVMNTISKKDYAKILKSTIELEPENKGNNKIKIENLIRLAKRKVTL